MSGAVLLDILAKCAISWRPYQTGTRLVAGFPAEMRHYIGPYQTVKSSRAKYRALAYTQST
jgi:hypothetical protein